MKKLLPNQSVKILFRNGTSVEGIVDVWDEDYILRSGDGKSYLIIQSPEQDILAIKVMLNENEISEPKVLIKEPPPPVENSASIPTQEELRTKKIAELHMLKIAQEKQEIANKLNSHGISEIKPIIYGYPNLNKIKGDK